MNILFLFVVIIFVIIFMFSVMVRIRPYQKGIKERLSKYVATLDSGWHFLIPFIENVRLVDMREKVINTWSHEMITRDNAVVTVDAVVYMQVVEAKKVIYEIDNPQAAVVQLALANLRSMIWQLILDECLSERWKINAYVQTHLSEETEKWWIKISRVEIQRIDPPVDLTQAMQEQKKAEQEKRAKILRAEWSKEAAIRQAEWSKEAAIRQAEWEKQSKVLRAEWAKEAKILQAEWEAQAIEKIAKAKAKALELEATAAINYFKWNAILKEQLKVTKEALMQNSKYIIDTDILWTIKGMISKNK